MEPKNTREFVEWVEAHCQSKTTTLDDAIDRLREEYGHAYRAQISGEPCDNLLWAVMLRVCSIAQSRGIGEAWPMMPNEIKRAYEG